MKIPENRGSGFSSSARRWRNTLHSGPAPPKNFHLSPFVGVLEGAWDFWRSAYWRLSLSLSRFFMWHSSS